MSNCAGLHPNDPYKVVIQPVESYAAYNYTNVTFHVESQQTFNVSVWSRNSNGTLSLSPASVEVTVPQLRKNVQLSCQ